jgi:hypothetical protein
MSKGKQRPDLVDVRPKDVMFSTAGQTGWAQKRCDISGHKGQMVEGDFHHLHSKFYDAESDGPIDE